MQCGAIFLLLISLLSQSAPAANARSGKGASSPIDAAKDGRLAVRVRLRAEAIPLRRVLRALADETGVRLDVVGSAGDERLVAFVPAASLADVMLAVADLYRLSWSRSGSGERARYQLVKPPAVAQEERDWREQALGQLRARLEEKPRGPQRPAGERPDPWAPVYPAVLPLLRASSTALLRDGYAYLPIAALPAEQRQQLVTVLQPAINDRHAWLQGMLRQEHEQRQAEGGAQPEPQSKAEYSPPPPAETSTLTLELTVRDELTASVGLKTTGGTQFGWFSVSSDSLPAAGLQGYEDRHPTLPTKADEAPEPPADPQADPLARVVDVPVEELPRPGDWISALHRLSDAAGVALYADCYPNYLQGTEWHPRSDYALAGKISAAHALNRLCFPLANRGARKLAVNSFWWRRGDAAFVRSRRWLWESAGVLPTDLLDRLTTSLRATGQIDPRDVPAIASLTALQVQSIGFLDGQWDTWRLAIQLPAQLSLGSRKLLLTSGLTWEKMPPADRALLGRLLSLPPGGSLSRYAARLKTSVSSNAAQGGTLASLTFEAASETGSEQSFVYFPLPGVSATHGLLSQGLQVTLASRDERPVETPRSHRVSTTGGEGGGRRSDGEAIQYRSTQRVSPRHIGELEGGSPGTRTEAVGKPVPAHVLLAGVPVLMDELHEEIVIDEDVGPAHGGYRVLRIVGQPARKDVLLAGLGAEGLLERGRAGGPYQVQALAALPRCRLPVALGRHVHRSFGDPPAGKLSGGDLIRPVSGIREASIGGPVQAVER
jgi:hypothetical protein